MTEVINLNWTDGDPDQEGQTYIGRGSPFGNPFSHLPSMFGTIRVSSREEAVESYRLWMTTDLQIPGWRKPTADEVESLRGRRLGCFCKPAACHGDVLIELLGER